MDRSVACAGQHCDASKHGKEGAGCRVTGDNVGVSVCRMLESRDFEDMIRRFPASEEPHSARNPLAEAAPRALREEANEANGCLLPALLPEEAR